MVVKDINSIPYTITEPGCYHIVQDLVYNSQDYTTFILQVTCADVTIDLSQHTIRQDNNNAYLNRDVSCIVITGGCGCITIKNGTLGRCSDSSILINQGFQGSIVINDVTFQDYETSAITSYHTGRIKVNRCNINKPLTSCPFSPEYDAARRLIHACQSIISQNIPNLVSLATAMVNLKNELDYDMNDYINTGSVTGVWFGSDRKYKACIYVDGPDLRICSCNMSGATTQLRDIYVAPSNDPNNHILDAGCSNIYYPTFIPNNKAYNWLQLIRESNIALNYPIPNNLIVGLASGQYVTGYLYNTLILQPEVIVIKKGSLKIDKVDIDAGGITCLSVNNLRKVRIVNANIYNYNIGLIVNSISVKIDNSTFSGGIQSIVIKSYQDLCITNTTTSNAVILNTINAQTFIQG